METVHVPRRIGRTTRACSEKDEVRSSEEDIANLVFYGPAKVRCSLRLRLAAITLRRFKSACPVQENDSAGPAAELLQVSLLEGIHGRTDGVLSANNVNGLERTEVDVAARGWCVVNQKHLAQERVCGHVFDSLGP